MYDNRTSEPKVVAFGRSEGAAFKDEEFYSSVKHLVEKKWEKKSKLKPGKFTLLAEKAMKKAVANVIVEHRQKNLPLVVWKNGRVVKIPANQL